MPYSRVILLMGLVPLLLSAPAWAQSLPVGTQPTVSSAPTTHPAGFYTPVIFSRCGQKAFIEISVKDPTSAVVLRAFGRTWGSPEPKRTPHDPGPTGAEITVPSVRVPTVFSVTPPERPERVLADLVAYPDKDVEWDNKIALYAAGPPLWFSQWAGAIGLPVKQLALEELPSAKLAPSGKDARSLLILDRVTAGKQLPDAMKLAKEKGVNVLVLDAQWFGEQAGWGNVTPSQMLGGLAETAKQRWPQPLKFAFHRRPWPGIANRWAWIVDGQGLPLVEEIRTAPPEGLPLLPGGDPPTREKAPQLEGTPRIILSYIPWQEQLGRSENADASFSALLSAAAATSRQCQWHPIRFVNGDWSEPENYACPILLAVRSGGFWKRPDLPHAKPEYGEPIHLILDLRGQGKGPNTTETNLSQSCRREIEGAPVVNLLILGDDRLLEEWKWLKLDRAKKTINRPGVVWLSNDELPPSKDNQIRLMLKLTEFGVPLMPPNQEEKKK